jgi:dolichol-phosphate mannosyltransferase
LIRTSVIVPTYNERNNIQSLYKGISNNLTNFEIIFVDDNSPDGTAEEIESLNSESIRLIKRKGKLGLGSAILEGAKAAKGQYLIMMDADLSHDVKAMPKMIEAANGADIVVGSRYTSGGEIIGWPLKRRIISRGATFIANLILGVLVKDPMSGFALFRRDVLRSLNGNLNPRGYKLLLEILVKSPKAVVREIPVTFRDRANGSSKMGTNEIVDYIKLCCDLWKYQHI